MLLVADNSAHTNISVDGTGDIAALIDGAGDVFSITAGGKAVVVSSPEEKVIKKIIQTQSVVGSV